MRNNSTLINLMICANVSKRKAANCPQKHQAKYVLTWLLHIFDTLPQLKSNQHNFSNTKMIHPHCTEHTGGTANFNQNVKKFNVVVMFQVLQCSAFFGQNHKPLTIIINITQNKNTQSANWLRVAFHHVLKDFFIHILLRQTVKVVSFQPLNIILATEECRVGLGQHQVQFLTFIELD